MCFSYFGMKNVKIIKNGDKYEVVYTKSAISVIENVVYAHDAERKWIQNHPIVQYEAYLLRYGIQLLSSKIEEKLFTYEFLTLEGKKLENGMKLALLSDADIIFMLKNLNMKGLVFEYFSRKDRRHPIWKSESEYKAIFDIENTNHVFKTVENGFENLIKYINFVNKSQEINENALQACEKDISETEKLLETIKADKGKLENMIATKNKHKKLLMCLKTFAHNQGISFDFLIIKADQFNSGFSKSAFGNLKIIFPELRKPCNFKNVTNVLSSNKSDGDKFFYIFYRRNIEQSQLNITDLAIELGKLAIEETLRR